MAITALLKENWREKTAKLKKAIVSLKKCSEEYRKERKSKWESLKSKTKKDPEEA